MTWVYRKIKAIRIFFPFYQSDFIFNKAASTDIALTAHLALTNIVVTVSLLNINPCNI